MKEGWKDIIKKHKKKVLFGFILGVLFMFFFGAKTVLYVQFLLGNDIIIELTPVKQEVEIVNGEEQELEVKVMATANPFCDVSCWGKWIDLATGTVVKAEAIALYPGVSSTQQFTVQANGEDERYVLYRYEVACVGEESVLCHTQETPTSGEIIVKVHMVLNEEQLEQKKTQQKFLATQARELEKITSIEKWSAASLALMKGTILQSIFDQDLERSKQVVQKEERWKEDAVALWKEQQFTSVEKLIIDATIQDSMTVVEELQQGMNKTVSEYNLFVAGVYEMRQSLQKMQENLPLFNQSVNERVIMLSEKYNNLLKGIGIVDFNTSKMLFENLNAEKEVVENIVVEQEKREQREKALELLVHQRVLCEIAGVCGNMSSVKEIIGSKMSVTQRCTEVKKFAGKYAGLSVQMKEAVKGVGYATDAGVLENVSKYVHNIRETEKAKLVLELQAENESELGKELLKSGMKESVSFAAAVNVTPLAVLAMNSFVQECMLPNVSYVALANVSIGALVLPKLQLQMGSEEKLVEQIPKCCVLGSCTACCVQKGCGELPILFVHGHAFNSDLSAEYSLNAFNGLQRKLEEEGYVNAGVVSLYTPTTEGAETWMEFSQPMSVKGSYYYDTYFTSGGYTLVQQKSEHIETYALRLKELVEAVQYKTGRDKIIIVAHSMGGLVARRYMQLFGEGSVAKLVMIGTPNKGVVGNIAEYCDIVGEQRECEDMNAQSLFMGKLNAGKKPSVPTSILVGIGCMMDGEEGDGVVLKDHAQLEGAKTTFVKGSCEGLETLHTQMLDVEKYPEVYSAIVEAVKG